MRPANLVNILVLVTATVATYLWTMSQTLTTYTLQLTGFLVLAYIITNRLYRRRSIIKKTAITLDLTLLTVIVLLLITATGSLSSPLFFMIYFLLFATAILFETTATLILTANICIFFILGRETDLSNLSHLTELIAVIMIAPLAILTSHQHEELLSAQKESHALGQSLKNEESSTLLFLSLNLKKTLLGSLDTLSQVIPHVSSPEVTGKLKGTYQDLKSLYHSATELQDTIDRETDARP